MGWVLEGSLESISNDTETEKKTRKILLLFYRVHDRKFQCYEAEWYAEKRCPEKRFPEKFSPGKRSPEKCTQKIFLRQKNARKFERIFNVHRLIPLHTQKDVWRSPHDARNCRTLKENCRTLKLLYSYVNVT